MKPHRVFIAINLPEEAKTELLAYQKKWPELPARWTTKANLHLTLAFLGNTSDAELTEVCELMQKVGLPAEASAKAGERYNPFVLTVNRIVYGPDEKRPRMIWALIEKSPELFTLQKDIEIALANSEKIRYRPEKRPWSPHLTLARLKTFELQQMELEELPDVNEEISVSFEIRSVETMESRLKRSGAEYNVVQTVYLSK